MSDSPTTRLPLKCVLRIYISRFRKCPADRRSEQEVKALSGGIDSPVGLDIMRKGVEIEAVHFHLLKSTGGYVKQLVDIMSERTGLITAHCAAYRTSDGFI